MANNSKPFQTKVSEMVSLRVASEDCLLSYTELYLLILFMQFFELFFGQNFHFIRAKNRQIRSLRGFLLQYFCFFLWNLAWNSALPLVFAK